LLRHVRQGDHGGAQRVRRHPQAPGAGRTVSAVHVPSAGLTMPFVVSLGWQGHYPLAEPGVRAGAGAGHRP
jgi:hypothetical protein